MTTGLARNDTELDLVLNAGSARLAPLRTIPELDGGIGGVDEGALGLVQLVPRRMPATASRARAGSDMCAVEAAAAQGKAREEDELRISVLELDRAEDALRAQTAARTCGLLVPGGLVTREPDPG